jgi:hypothetical protein
LSPEKLHIALGQGFHFLETNISSCAKGEYETDVPGSKSVAGKRTDYVGTWENRITPRRSFREAEKAMRKYDDSVVGLTHSRGVGSVMPVESRNKGILEGVSRLTQRDGDCHAVH